MLTVRAVLAVYAENAVLAVLAVLAIPAVVFRRGDFVRASRFFLGTLLLSCSLLSAGGRRDACVTGGLMRDARFQIPGSRFSVAADGFQ